MRSSSLAARWQLPHPTFKGKRTPLAHYKCDRWTDLQQAHPLQPWVSQMSSRACAPPVSSLNPPGGGTPWLLAQLGFRLALLLLAARLSRAAAARLSNSTDLVRFHAETSSAKAALATSVSADTSGKAAPAPGAPLKSGRVAQPGFPVAARERCVNTPPSQEEGCCNIQWLLFIFGIVLFLPSCIGVVLPLFSRPRFPTRGHKCAPQLGALP